MSNEKIKQIIEHPVMRELMEGKRSKHNRGIPVAFLKSCQDYVRLYDINEGFLDCKKVLQEYIDADRSEKEVRLDMEDKLYVEFFAHIYNEGYKDMCSWEEAVKYDKISDVILADYFHGKTSVFTRNIDKVLGKNFDYSLKRWDLTNLHQAMGKLENALMKTPEPTIENSVERLISEERLDDILYFLDDDNIPGVIFTIAPMTRALTDGAYRKFVAGRKRKGAFFNLKSEYNLKELREHIDKYKDLYERYTDTREELQELKNSAHSGKN